jgi:hypothetical protein
MLLCRRDVEIGVLALKSLLRFRETAWAVSLTDDGSLTDRQRSWIDQHVPGCRWLLRVSEAPAVRLALQRLPRLRALYMGNYQPLRKLLHPALLARTEKVLVLDPDTIFSRRPERLAAWAEGDGESAGLFLLDHQDESTMVPQETISAFDELRMFIRPDGPWSMPSYFFNSGLLAYSPALMDLTLAERYLEWRETAPAKYITGKPGLWFGDWTPEQTAYQVIFAAMEPPAVPFGDEYRIGRRPGHTFNHFLWLQLVMPSSLGMLQAVIQELPR